MRRRITGLGLIISICCTLGLAAMWLRSYYASDELWRTDRNATGTIGLSSTRGSIALMTTTVQGNGRTGGNAGLHVEHSTPVDIRSMGWPVDSSYSAGGFLLRRFRSLMTAPSGTSGTSYTVHWKVVAIPYWFALSFAAGISVLFGKFYFDLSLRKMRVGFPLYKVLWRIHMGKGLAYGA